MCERSPGLLSRCRGSFRVCREPVGITGRRDGGVGNWIGARLTRSRHSRSLCPKKTRKWWSRTRFSRRLKCCFIYRL
jgi:hypothetical protein